MNDISEKWQAIVNTLDVTKKPLFKGSVPVMEGNILVVYLPVLGVEIGLIKERFSPLHIQPKVNEWGEEVLQIEYKKGLPKPEPEELSDIPQTSILPKGFTPIVDSLAKELGLVTSAIYGVIWRHCQMNSHTCYASQNTIAERLKLSRRCVNQNIKTLLNDGYIRCLNEKEIGKTKVYIVTNKVSIQAAFVMEAKINGQV